MVTGQAYAKTFLYNVPFHKDERLEVLCSQGRPLCSQNVRPVAEHSLAEAELGSAVLYWRKCLTQISRNSSGNKLRASWGAGPSLNLFPDLFLNVDELVLGLLPPHIVKVVCESLLLPVIFPFVYQTITSVYHYHEKPEKTATATSS